MKQYILLFVLLYAPLGAIQPDQADLGFEPAGVFYADGHTAEYIAQAIAGVPELRAQIAQLNTTIEQQNKTIWCMRIVFIVAGVGFSVGIAKKVYEYWKKKNHVSSKTHGLLQQFKQSAHHSKPESCVSKR